LRTSKVAKRIAALLTGVAAVAVLVAPAAYADDPSFSGSGWAALTISADGPQSTSRGSSTYGPYTVMLSFGNGFDTASGVNWSTAPGTGAPEWWPNLNVSGFQLQRTQQCSDSAFSCEYNIVSGGGEFSYQYGDLGTDQFPATQNITLNPPLPASMTINVNPNLNPLKGSGGEPGQITLDASGTTDGFTNPDSLTYSWVVTNDTTHEATPASGKVAKVPLSEDGQYTVSLTVANPADGYSQSWEGGSSGGVFQITGVAPDRALPTPGPAPAKPSLPVESPGTPAPAPAPIPVVFEPAPSGGGGDVPAFFAPRSIPSALNGGSNGEAQVVWLWRPDWFQPGSLTPQQPVTATPPKLSGNEPIVVSSSTPAPDSDATPWLAGLAVFGLAGLGLMATKRWRMRHPYAEL
jgi:hypothetical protein